MYNVEQVLREFPSIKIVDTGKIVKHNNKKMLDVILPKSVIKHIGETFTRDDIAFIKSRL